MQPALIGYFPKRTTPRPDWLQAPTVEEICSASCCISPAPDGWVDHWRHNDLWLYDTEEAAWSVTPPEARQEFNLYAYAMLPTRWDAGREETYDLPPLRVQPLPGNFARLGWDAVSRNQGTAFECSPLSCNGRAEVWAVNRYCLAETEQEAVALARACSADGCEPGPYHVVTVWRLVACRHRGEDSIAPGAVR